MEEINLDDMPQIKLELNGRILESHMEGEIRIIDKLSLQSVDIIFEDDDSAQEVRQKLLLRRGALTIDALDQESKNSE